MNRYDAGYFFILNYSTGLNKLTFLLKTKQYKVVRLSENYDMSSTYFMARFVRVDNGSLLLI